MRVWVDASTLIALESIGEVLVLRDLLGQIAITPPIADEVFTGRESRPLRETRERWIEVVPVRGDRSQTSRLASSSGSSAFLAAAIKHAAPGRTNRFARPGFP